MNQPFEPLNDLERALMAALQGQLPVAAFMQTLLAAQVYVLTGQEHRPATAADPSATPMVLTNAAKTPFLAVFTAPERTEAWAKRQSTFRSALATDFNALLAGMAPDLGLAINPGLQAGFELQPATVAQLKTQKK